MYYVYLYYILYMRLSLLQLNTIVGGVFFMRILRICRVHGY